MRFIAVVLTLLWTGIGAAEEFVVVCPITGMIDDGIGVLVDRAVREAAGAKAIVFDINTPGGLVDSAIRICDTILKAPCPTIAYIHGGMGATSAGALISFACKHMIMAPDSTIGAATPVTMSPEGVLPTGEKEVSFMRAKMRALAERNDHNPALAEAMVDKDIELRASTDAEGKLRIVAVYPERVPVPDEESSKAAENVKKTIENLPPELEGIKKLAKDLLPEEKKAAPAQPQTPTPRADGAEVILPAGKLLTLTAKEALKYGLIPAIAINLEEALAHYGYAGASIRRIEATWAEALFRWLTNPLVTGLLLMFGIGGLYIELKTPGVVLPGVVGLVCLTLFFGSHYLIGVAEWIHIALVVAGIVLILVEIFVTPGFGVIGLAGICCLFAGLFLTLTGVAIPQYSWDYDRLRNATFSLSVAAVTLAALVYVTWRLFPHTPLYPRFVQTHEQRQDRGYTVQTAEEHNAAIGLRGVATTMLRPAGRGRFGDETYQVVSRGEYIPPGTPIEIVQVDGNRYVVDRLEENA